MTKIMATEQAMEKCPRINQIRLLSKYNIAAKGPTDARALTRKIVGNEEFCLQIDSHTAFVQDWDVVAKEEWHATGNEFAVLSTAPARISEQQDYESWTGSKSGEVPRQCFPKILDNNIPVRLCVEIRMPFIAKLVSHFGFRSLYNRTFLLQQMERLPVLKSHYYRMPGIPPLAFQSVILKNQLRMIPSPHM